MKLYKFKSLENEGFFYAVDMIVNERVYLATCDQINDPEEGTWDMPGLNSSGRTNQNAPSFSRNEYLQHAKELRSVIDAIRFASFAGETSVGEPLLWAHYAGGFRGVAFEYNVDDAQYDIRPVDYDNKKIELTIEQMRKLLAGEILPQDVDVLRRKAECWGYEDEYRLYQTVGEPSENNKYVALKLSRVVLGCQNSEKAKVVRDDAGVSPLNS